MPASATQTQVLQATMSANARNSAYQTATSLAVTQADIQDTQLTSLSGSGDPAQHGDLDRHFVQRPLDPDEPGAKHLQSGGVALEFAGCQRRLYLWRRQRLHAAGEREFSVAAGRAPIGVERFHQRQQSQIRAGGRRPDRHLWRHRLQCGERFDAGAAEHRAISTRARTAISAAAPIFPAPRTASLRER